MIHKHPSYPLQPYVDAVTFAAQSAAIAQQHLTQRAVMAVRASVPVSRVAEAAGVSRRTVDRWVRDAEVAS